MITSTTKTATRLIGLALAVLLVSACGGVQFERTTGVPKFRPLPPGTQVQVVEESATLPTPNIVVGVLGFDTTGATPVRPEIDDQFRKHAARYGCDAVAGVEAQDERKQQTTRVRKLGMDGKPVYEVKTVELVTWHWKGRCIRTSEAPGGLPANLPSADAAGPDQPSPEAKPEVPASTGLPEDAKTAAQRLARRLLDLSDPYLMAWRERLDVAEPDAMEVLEAFNELAFQVSGAGGFWRKTVHQDWFGCPSAPSSEQCVKLAKAEPALVAADRLQHEIGNLAHSRAASWLRRNEQRLVTYLEDLVPKQTSFTAMKETSFYQAFLQ